MSDKTDKLIAYAERGADENALRAVASLLGINAVFDDPCENPEKPVLRLGERGLFLSCGALTLQADFSKMLPRLRADRLRGELLVRAAKVKLDGVPTAADATAGLGEDALLLAASGFSVILYERDETIAALLSDALRRAAETPELREIAARMKLINGDSIKALSLLSYAPDVIYLDPMFPKRQKSALVKKKFQLLHMLEAPCSDEARLLSAAISAHPKKIVIKRPAREDFLAGVRPNYSLEGSGIRYDCIVLN